MKYVALICARGGSKGLPGKNIKPLAGIPLIGRSIMIAKKIDRISRIVVSTDSDEIARVAREFGADVPFMRPPRLSQDDSSEWLVWQHALDFLNKDTDESFDGIVSLPPTAPLRNENDVNKCIDEFEKGDADIVITMSIANRNPYFNMVTVNNDGYASVAVPMNKNIFHRQDAPAVFDMTTVAYVASTNFVLKSKGVFDGRVRGVNIPIERAIDIDTLLDFKLAEFFLKEGCIEDS